MNISRIDTIVAAQRDVAVPAACRATRFGAFVSSLVLLPLLLCACSGDDKEGDAATPNALVSLVSAAPRTLHESLVATGVAEPAPDGVQEIAVPYEAVVTHLAVAQGASVTRGQLLFELAVSPSAHLAPAQAARDATLAAAERGRLERLHGAGLATNNELRAAANAAASAQEQLVGTSNALASDAANARTHAITAPSAGVVDLLTIKQGGITPAATMLARIVQPDHLLIRLGVEPADAARLNLGSQVHLVTLATPARHGNSTVTNIDRRVDADSHLAAVTVAAPPQMHLLPGEVVRGELVTASHSNALCVPRNALLYDGDAPFVFVVHGAAPKQQAQRRAVQLGLRDNDYVEILQGVTAGEHVVVLGNAELSDGMNIRTTDNAAP